MLKFYDCDHSCKTDNFFIGKSNDPLLVFSPVVLPLFFSSILSLSPPGGAALARQPHSRLQSEGGGPEDLCQDPTWGLVMRCNTGRRLVKCYRVVMNTVHVRIYRRLEKDEEEKAGGRKGVDNSNVGRIGGIEDKGGGGDRGNGGGRKRSGDEGRKGGRKRRGGEGGNTGEGDNGGGRKRRGGESRNGGEGGLVEAEEEHDPVHPYCRYEHVFLLDQSRLDADIGDRDDENYYY